GHGRELGELDAGAQAARLARIEAPGADLEHGRGGAADRGPQRRLERLAVVPRREQTREQDVTGADGGERVDPLDRRAEAAHDAVLAEQRVAGRLSRDQDVARAEV